jgi:hypothetical protein
MPKDITIDLEKTNRAWLESIGGMKLTVQPSPFDVPQTIRIKEPAKPWLRSKRLVINFEYLAREPVENRVIGSGLRASVGKTSHRFYSLSIDPTVVPERSRTSPDRLSNWLASAVRRFSYRYPDSHRRQNYLLTRKAIHEAGQAVFELIQP